MVRKYKRKTNQHQWTEVNMIAAITAVKQENMSMNNASKTLRVPLATLFRRCKKAGNVENLAKKQLGRFRPIFNEEQETDLKNHVLSLKLKENFQNMLNYVMKEYSLIM